MKETPLRDVTADDKPITWFTRGVANIEKENFVEAEFCFRQTLALAPESQEALLSLGYVLDQQGLSNEAFHCYESALSVNPQNAKAHYNRAAHLLRMGNLKDGFADYEYRFSAMVQADSRTYSQPRWDGICLNGQSILVYCEQGLGDALQFCRYIPLVAQRGGRVFLEVQPSLVSLLSTVEGVEKVFVKSETPPPTDVHIPLLSLPHIFQTTLESIPASIPYLSVSEEKINRWKTILADDVAGIRIGVSWAGKAHPYPQRSCPPEFLAPLLETPGVSFYSLQLGELDRFPMPHDYLGRIIDLTSKVTDFSDTAALIANLDLVITIDSALAHLAGALGRPVWVMLPAMSDWRWMTGRDDSPWYPTMRLFRQSSPGAWSSVIRCMVHVLQGQLSPQAVTAEASEEIQEHDFQAALTALEANAPDAAILCLDALREHLPDEPAILFNLGRAYAMKGCFNESEYSYRQALMHNAESPAIWFGLGWVCLKHKKYSEAATCLCRAYTLKPDSVDILLALGSAFVQLDMTTEAFDCCRKALDLDPEYAEAVYNMAYLQLRSGDYRAGFANFEARLRMKNQKADVREYRQPRWDGTALNGKTILVYGEQGMGDVIQFARYVPLLVEMGGTVVLEVDPPLLPLFEQFPGVAKLVAKSKIPPLTDVYIQTLSLPHLFGTTLETVPNRVPYVLPDPIKVEQWRHRLDNYEPAFRIGLVWRGNPQNPLDQDRSCPLDVFSPLADLPGVCFFSLQVGVERNEAAYTTSRLNLIDFTGHLHDFSDTAAFISVLDLVIGVDTAVTHLAGAVGKPVWVILPHIYDWRWLVGRTDTPWYPTARVFWQSRQGDWTGVISAVKEALSEHLNGIQSSAGYLMDVEAVYENGIRLKEAGDLAGSEKCFRHIVEEYPELPDPQHSLGVVLQLQGRLQEAIRHYRCAIADDPEFVKAHYNLASALQLLGLYQEAIAAIRTALKYDPAHADAHWLLGMLLLQSGNFQEGWQEYEWRWQASGFTSRIPDLGRPQWDGSPLNGRTLLIHMEQGRGDMIQFVRYAPLAAATGGKVVACALPELVPLLTMVDGISLVVDRNGSLPDFDVHIPVQSLPYLFGTTLDTVPAKVPYLYPASKSVRVWAEKLAADRRGFRIGLVWTGNEQPNANRTCPLSNFAPLFDLPDTVFYSLQMGRQETTSQNSEYLASLVDHTGIIRDFSDTAALMINLDLVISIDTASAHLAGALGRPVWTLIPFISDWRWLLARDDSPWYPTMRLFRQETPRDWAGVIGRVRKQLLAKLSRDAMQKQDGMDLLKAGQPSEAERVFAEAIADDPSDANAYSNCGVALDAQGRHEEAVLCYQKALLLKPDFMQAAFNLGNVYVSLGKLENARFCYDHVIELSPSFVPAYLCLGEIGKTLRDFEKGRFCYEHAAVIDPACAEAFQGIAEILQAEESYEEAIVAYKKALALEPDRVNALNMMGSAYQCLGQLEEAANWYQQALRVEPERPTAMNNLGVVLTSQGVLDEAVAVLRHLVASAPEYAEGHWNLSVALLASGNYLDGWREYEWRFRKAGPVVERKFDQPRWDGADMHGKTILLHAEQGFGDTIQFIRYVPLLAEQGATVVVECQVPILKELLHSVAGVSDVVAFGEPLPHFDCHLPLMSLPLAFGTTLETIPSRVPYLSASSEKIDLWRRRLGTSTKKRVGLAWYAKQSQVLNRKRTCPLHFFAPLWAVPDVEFYTLQIGDGADQLDEFRSGHEIIDLTNHIRDFADTAAIMANLDMVITIDTAAAHLAGALGVHSWVVLPHVAEWRWLNNRDDSPWYPTMRLFRQPSPGDWPSLMDTVAGALLDSANATSVGRALPSARSRLRVGLAWSGRQDNAINCKRSCPFSALAPLFELDDITFVKLQMDSDDGLDVRLIDVTGQIQDFEDTAAVMAQLDLIVTIDTSVAHLAAATGCPTWVLLAHVADWRWSTGPNSSPWYPDVKLFRQPDFGDWDSVIREVAHRLVLFSEGRLACDSNVSPLIGKGNDSGERRALERLLEDNLTVLQLNRPDPDAHLDAGASYALLGRHVEASEAFGRVLALNPDHVAGHLNLAYSLLAAGEYAEGWRHFEWRLKRLPPGQLPPWPMLERHEVGKHAVGTSLLVHCEQGYGDTFQFARFLPMLADLGYRVLVSCQPSVATLIESVHGINRVVPHGLPLPVCDLQVLLLSLPWVLDVTVATLPTQIPYLLPGEQRVKAWQSRLEAELLSVQKKI